MDKKNKNETLHWNYGTLNSISSGGRNRSKLWEGLFNPCYKPAVGCHVINSSVNDVVWHQDRVGAEHLPKLVHNLSLVMIIACVRVAHRVGIAVGEDWLRKERKKRLKGEESMYRGCNKIREWGYDIERRKVWYKGKERVRKRRKNVRLRHIGKGM